jgi:hypothetical protein
VPPLNHPLRGNERCARVYDGGSAVRSAERQCHRAVGSEETAAVFVERGCHLQLAAGELVVAESRPLFDQEYASAAPDQWRKLLCNRSTPSAGPDDDDVVLQLVDHGSTQSTGASGTVEMVPPRASQPSALAR